MGFPPQQPLWLLATVHSFQKPLLFVIPPAPACRGSVAEGPAVRHSGTPPLPAHNLHQIIHRTHRNTLLRQLPCTIIPMQRGQTTGPLLVSISLAIILIHRELTISPGVHPDLSQPLHLASILHHLP